MFEQEKNDQILFTFINSRLRKPLKISKLSVLNIGSFKALEQFMQNIYSKEAQQKHMSNIFSECIIICRSKQKSWRCNNQEQFNDLKQKNIFPEIQQFEIIFPKPAIVEEDFDNSHLSYLFYLLSASKQFMKSCRNQFEKQPKQNAYELLLYEIAKVDKKIQTQKKNSPNQHLSIKIFDQWIATYYAICTSQFLNFKNANRSSDPIKALHNFFQSFSLFSGEEKFFSKMFMFEFVIHKKSSVVQNLQKCKKQCFILEVLLTQDLESKVTQTITNGLEALFQNQTQSQGHQKEIIKENKKEKLIKNGYFHNFLYETYSEELISIVTFPKYAFFHLTSKHTKQEDWRIDKTIKLNSRGISPIETEDDYAELYQAEYAKKEFKFKDKNFWIKQSAQYSLCAILLFKPSKIDTQSVTARDYVVIAKTNQYASQFIKFQIGEDQLINQSKFNKKFITCPQKQAGLEGYEAIMVVYEDIEQTEKSKCKK